MSPLLEGKVAVITGSSRGLGLAIAQVYAREGAAVVLVGRSMGSLEKARAQLAAQGAKVSAFAADVSNLEEVKALAAHAAQTFGKIDIWVNNAGVSGTYGPTSLIEPDIFVNVINTNILGTYYGSVVALQHFRTQGSGKLINLLGRGDKKPVTYQNAYASSKVWIRSFTKALAKEHAHMGIGVFAFNPGLVDTDMLRKLDAVEGFERKLKPLSIVIRLWANPADVPAQRALWLASSATDGKTGIETQVLTMPKMIGGLVRDLWNSVRRVPKPDTSLDITSHKPFAL